MANINVRVGTNTANTVVIRPGGATNQTVSSVATFVGYSDTANQAFTIATEAYAQSNTAISVAQQAYNKANSSSSSANAAFDKANSANVLAQSSFNQANSANVLAQAAFDKANTSSSSSANAAFDKANSAYLLAQASFNKANTIGTLGTQNSNTILVTGGTLDNVAIGATTPNTGVFTSLTSNGIAQFGKGFVNYHQFVGANTGNTPIHSVAGTNANIALTLQSKGTGAIDLAAGSSGINISNGNTVTAITAITNGSNYTSVPSVAISAPTTAGGVQATANAAVYVWSNPTASVGSGYANTNVLTAVGGTGSPYTITVTNVDGSGGITAFTIGNYGYYTVVPPNPVQFSSSSGSGFTSNMTWTVHPTYIITNAGSGYVEQPTVTISGGGGSGATAYATIGGGTIVRNLGNTLDFYSPSGIGFRVGDGGTATSGYWTAFPNTSSPSLRAIGSSSGQIATGSAVPIQFLTNATTASVEQFRVSHTPNAGNYVQATGAALGGNAPTISAQGGDPNVTLALASKGVASVQLVTNSKQAFDAYASPTSVNWIRATGAATGVSPSFNPLGSDTNIDITLAPKGTGKVLVAFNSGLGFANTSGLSAAYTYYNAGSNSIDTVFG